MSKWKKNHENFSLTVSSYHCAYDQQKNVLLNIGLV